MRTQLLARYSGTGFFLAMLKLRMAVNTYHIQGFNKIKLNTNSCPAPLRG